MQQLKITAMDTSGLEITRPVKGGVPLPEGAVDAGSMFILKKPSGAGVPLQSKILSKWGNGSARWVLLDFLHNPKDNKGGTYYLSHSSSNGELQDSMSVFERSIPSDKSSLTWGDDELLRVSDKYCLNFKAVNNNGKEYSAKLDSVEIETTGSVRSTICLSGSFIAADGERLFSFRLWASVFTGLSKVLIEPMVLFDPEKGILTKIRSLSISVRPVRPIMNTRIGGVQGPQDPEIRLMQVDDQNFRVEGADIVGEKAPGWVELNCGSETISVAMRDFWQQWPKAFGVNSENLSIELFPSFNEGEFAHMEPWYKHEYLFEKNFYKLRTGQSRRWQIWIDTALSAEDLALSANVPVVLAADPQQALATGVWGRVMPAGAKEMQEYDTWVKKLTQKYAESIASQRDYGAMNWGDWWGERETNWGNHEYDTPQHLLLLFARTGDPKYFLMGDVAARHTSEVDVIHYVNDDLKNYFEREFPGFKDYPVRAGMVHEHSIGHVGGFYEVQKIRDLYISLGIGKTKNPYLCLDPYNLGHIFTIGMMYNYFLTGDPWIKETLETIRENLVKLVEDRVFPFKGEAHEGRKNGWTMLAIAGTYELDYDERCLAAMKLLADDALSEQDPYCGGWLYELPWGHCFCTTKKHVGEAGFITSVRINGLARYFDLTGDSRIPEAIQRGITHLNNDTWRDENSDWRYTSCPASSMVKQLGVIIAALASSVRLTGDQRHLAILRKAWKEKFQNLKSTLANESGVGKSFSISVYGSAEAASLLAEIDAQEQNESNQKASAQTTIPSG